MTVPTLLIKHQKQVYVTRLKKAYSNLQNAMQMIPISQGCSAGDYECAGMNSLDDKKAFNILAAQFKTSSVNTDGLGNCPQITSRSGMCMTLEDGIMIEAANDAFGGVGVSSSIGVDVNGIQGPNKLGRDQFMFYFITDDRDAYSGYTKGKVLPFGFNTKNVTDWKSYCTSAIANNKTEASAECTAEVLRTGKMDY